MLKDRTYHDIFNKHHLMPQQHSSSYTKSLIEHQLDILKEPLVLDEPISDMLSNHAHSDKNTQVSESQLHDVLNKVNASMNTRYNEIFTSQRNDEVISSIIDAEFQKLAKVDRQIFKIYHQLQSFELSGFNKLATNDKMVKLQRLRELIDELPRPKYIYLSDIEGNIHHMNKRLDVINGSNRREEAGELKKDRARPELSAQDQNSSCLLSELEQVKYTDGDKRSELLQTYASLRNQLTTSSKILRYDFEKLEYLRSLNTKLEETFDTKNRIANATSSDNNGTIPDDNLQEEINRFRILAERIAYKFSLKNLQSS